MKLPHPTYYYCMKGAVFNSLKIAFIIIGTVIGAGFISGKEIIRFFGGGFLLPSSYFCALLFFLFTYLLLTLGNKYGGFAAGTHAVFGKTDAALETVLLFASLIIVGAMLAGVDSLMLSQFGIPKSFPLASFVSMVAAYFITGKGVKGLAAVNFILVPVMIAVILSFLSFKGNIQVQKEYSGADSGAVMTLFYVSMNIFLSAPVLLELGAANDKKSFAAAGGIAAVVISVCVFLIVSGIKYEGANAENAEMPLLYLFGKVKYFSAVFSLVVFFGIFTTLLSSYFPLFNYASRFKRKRVLDFVILIMAFAVSRLGLDKIVLYLYPVLGFLGFLYVALSAVHLFRQDVSLNPLISRQ